MLVILKFHKAYVIQGSLGFPAISINISVKFASERTEKRKRRANGGRVETRMCMTVDRELQATHRIEYTECPAENHSCICTYVYTHVLQQAQISVLLRMSVSESTRGPTRTPCVYL